MSTNEDRIMAERRPQAMPPTPRNPALERTGPLMYTGETREEFYSRRQALEGLWNGFMAGQLGFAKGGAV